MVSQMSNVSVPTNGLSVSTVPTISPVVGRLAFIRSEDDNALERIVDIINTDPGLTARVLAVANAPFFGLSYKVKTVAEASVVIGTRGLVQIALGLAIKSTFHTLRSTAATHVQALWRHSVGVGMTAEAIARRCRHPSPQEAFVAGLLHDIGKLLWIRECPDTYIPLLEGHSDRAFPEREQQSLGQNHADLGYTACRHWRLPDTISEAIGAHHRASEAPASETPLVNVLVIANQVTKLADVGFSGNPFVETGFLSRLESQGVTTTDLVEIMTGLAAQVSQLERLFAIHDGSSESQLDSETPVLRVGLAMNSKNYTALIALVLRSLGHDVETAQRFGNWDHVDTVVTDDSRFCEKAGNTEILTLDWLPAEDEALVCTATLRTWLLENLPELREENTYGDTCPTH